MILVGEALHPGIIMQELGSLSLPSVRIKRAPKVYKPNGPRECARRVRQAEAAERKRRSNEFRTALVTAIARTFLADWEDLIIRGDIESSETAVVL